MRILVVDDDRSVRDALRRALMLGGYDVRCADGGHGALTETLEYPPDAIVLDLNMPDVNGLEVCERLRARGNRVPNAPGGGALLTISFGPSAGVVDAGVPTDLLRAAYGGATRRVDSGGHDSSVSPSGPPASGHGSAGDAAERASRPGTERPLAPRSSGERAG